MGFLLLVNIFLLFSERFYVGFSQLHESITRHFSAGVCQTLHNIGVKAGNDVINIFTCEDMEIRKYATGVPDVVSYELEERSSPPPKISSVCNNYCSPQLTSHKSRQFQQGPPILLLLFYFKC